MSAPLLELRDVTAELPVEGELRPVLRGVGFSLARGEVLGVVGESGSGKSMLARAILRTLPDGARCGGEVLLDGVDLLSLGGAALREVRAQRIGMVFQDPRAFVDPLWRAGAYVTEPLRVNHRLGREEARAQALRLFGDVGIVEPERVFRAYPHELSGGMLQRVAIAGALATDPDLLIADEPTTALDVTIQAEIMAVVQELSRTRGMATIFVSHDLDLAAMVCDRVLVVYAGAVMVEQPTARLLEAPSHPYARALLDARPRVDARLPRMQTVPGQPASAVRAPEGCPFHPRCAYAVDRCRTAALTPQEVRPGEVTTCVRLQAGELPTLKETRAIVV
ncbi:MAG: ABC transporter ATP-binding protein [Actinobacteria bacterium]|nr:ABC transporter ATP-binding protein [Actinomycetota bacterium]